MILRRCRHCHRAIYRTTGGVWYHVHTAATRCQPSAGPSPVAEPGPDPEPGS